MLDSRFGSGLRQHKRVANHLGFSCPAAGKDKRLLQLGAWKVGPHILWQEACLPYQQHSLPLQIFSIYPRTQCEFSPCDDVRPVRRIHSNAVSRDLSCLWLPDRTYVGTSYIPKRFSRLVAPFSCNEFSQFSPWKVSRARDIADKPSYRSPMTKTSGNSCEQRQEPGSESAQAQRVFDRVEAHYKGER